MLSADERMISAHSLVRCEAIKLAKEPKVRGRGRPAASPHQMFLLSKKDYGEIAERTSIQDYDFD